VARGTQYSGLWETTQWPSLFRHNKGSWDTTQWTSLFWRHNSGAWIDTQHSGPVLRNFEIKRIFFGIPRTLPQIIGQTGPQCLHLF
jgi:hypothetical protein